MVGVGCGFDGFDLCGGGVGVVFCFLWVVLLGIGMVKFVCVDVVGGGVEVLLLVGGFWLMFIELWLFMVDWDRVEKCFCFLGGKLRGWVLGLILFDLFFFCCEEDEEYLGLVEWCEVCDGFECLGGLLM